MLVKRCRHLNLFFLISLITCIPVGISAADNTPWYSQTVESKNGVFLVTLESTDSEFALNEFRNWQLILTDKASGKPVSPARFTIGGGMPMHGHGFPSQPQVTSHLGEGKYSIEGVRFNMLGKWLFQIEVVTRTVADSVAFEVIVDF